MSESWSEYHTNPGDHGLLRDYRYSDKGTLGSDGTGGCDYITAIDYSSTLTGGSYYFGQPKNVIVSKGDELFHCVSATYSSAIPTEVTSIRRALEFREGGNGIQPASGPDTHGSDSGLAVSCDFAETEYSYDPCGNLKSVRLPCPSSSDTTRVWYRYEYDNVLNTHLRKITDAFGLSNVSDSLDLRYGMFRQSQDRNNQYSWTSYDDLGRMTGVRTPFDDSYGNTVSFSYKPIADTANGIGNYVLNGWRVCHIEPVGLNSRKDIEEIDISILEEHFWRYLSPKNMFLIPKSISGLGEIQEFIDEQR